VLASPSGKYHLRLVTETESVGGRDRDYLRPVILDADGGELYRSPTRVAGWFGVATAWDEADRAWIASADSGTTVLSAVDGRWTRAVWDPGAPAAVMWDAETGEEVPVIAASPPPGIGEGAR